MFAFLLSARITNFDELGISLAADNSTNSTGIIAKFDASGDPTTLKVNSKGSFHIEGNFTNLPSNWTENSTQIVYQLTDWRKPRTHIYTANPEFFQKNGTQYVKFDVPIPENWELTYDGKVVVLIHTIIDGGYTQNKTTGAIYYTGLSVANRPYEIKSPFYIVEEFSYSIIHLIAIALLIVLMIIFVVIAYFVGKKQQEAKESKA